MVAETLFRVTKDDGTFVFFNTEKEMNQYVSDNKVLSNEEIKIRKEYLLGDMSAAQANMHWARKHVATRFNEYKRLKRYGIVDNVKVFELDGVDLYVNKKTKKFLTSIELYVALEHYNTAIEKYYEAKKVYYEHVEKYRNFIKKYGLKD